MANIFLTGATGFIGAHVAQHLAAQGHQLTLLVRRQPPVAISGRPLLPAGSRRICGELCDPAGYRQALAECDVVIHLAADYRIGFPDRASERRKMYQTNVAGSLALADAAFALGIKKFIYTSTTAALGETFNTLPGESHPHNSVFRCYYEETKHIAHHLMLSRAKKGLPLMTAVLGGVFGEGDTSSLTQVMNDFLNGKLPVQPDSQSRFQLCHVSHIVDAFDLLLQQPLQQAPADNCYLFTGQDYAMPEILTVLSGIAGKPAPKKVAVSRLKLPAGLMDVVSRLGVSLPLSKEVVRIMDGSTYTYSSAKAQARLGWSAGDTQQELIRYMQFLINTSTGK